MQTILTNKYKIAQAPPPGGPPGGGPPGGPGGMPPPPPPPSDFLFHEAAKNEIGEWGAYFTIKATGKRMFVPEGVVRSKAKKNEKTQKVDMEVSKALARIEAAKLNDNIKADEFAVQF